MPSRVGEAGAGDKVGYLACPASFRKVPSTGEWAQEGAGIECAWAGWSVSRMSKALVVDADAATVQKLTAAIQDNDKVLAASIAKSRVVLGFGFDPHGGSQPPKRMFGTAFAGDDPSQFLPVQQGTVKPLAMLEAAAKGNGIVNTDVEGSVIRRVPMLFRVAGQEGLF